MLGRTAQAIANGAPAARADGAKGPDTITHPLPLARIHQYISMATPLLWMRQPDRAGGLGLALNAAHEANVDGVPDADLIRRALSVAAELWAGIGEIQDRQESELIARPARMLVHIADILAVTAPALGGGAGRASRRGSSRRQATAAIARSTSVASTVRFHALCGWPGRPASGSAGSSARGMLATPAATSVSSIAPPRSRDRDERERERLPLARAEIDRRVRRRGQPHRDDDLAHLERDERAVLLGRPAVELEQRHLTLAARASARRRSRRTPRARARGRRGAPRCSRPPRGCACGGRRSARSRCRRRRASSATPRRGSTSSACAGRGCRRPCPGCAGAARPRARPPSRRPRTGATSSAARELGERRRRADPDPRRRRRRCPPRPASWRSTSERRRADPAVDLAREVGAAGEHGSARPARAARAPRRPLPASRSGAHASASSTRSRVRGSAAARRPVACANAFAIAAAVGTIGGSPSPLAPTFGRFASGDVREVDHDLGHVGDRRDLVVVEVRVDRNARRRVDDELLRERERHPLQDAALDLARGGERVDDPPDVVDGDDPLDAHLAEAGIDRDLRDLAAERVDDEAVRVRRRASRSRRSSRRRASRSPRSRRRRSRRRASGSGRPRSRDRRPRSRTRRPRAGAASCAPSPTPSARPASPTASSGSRPATGP